VKTILRTAVVKQCPYKPETDHGEVVITLAGPAPELHAFGAQIDGLSAEPISHEDYTAGIAALLPAGGTVTTRWHTGRWSVEVQDGAPDAVLR